MLCLLHLYSLECNEVVEYYIGYYYICYCSDFSPVQKLEFVYRLLVGIIRYNLGDVRYDLVSPMFAEKSAIRSAVSKYFPDTSFTEIESDFRFIYSMD